MMRHEHEKKFGSKTGHSLFYTEYILSKEHREV